MKRAADPRQRDDGGSLPTPDEVGFPGGIARGDWKAVERLARELVDAALINHHERLSGREWIALDDSTVVTQAKDKRWSSAVLYTHLRDLAIRGDGSARLGLLLLGHLHGVLLPAIKRDMNLAAQGIKDGKKTGLHSKRIAAARIVRDRMADGVRKMAAMKQAMKETGLTLKQVRKALGE